MDPLFWMFSTIHIVLGAIVFIGSIAYAGYYDLDSHEAHLLIVISFFTAFLLPIVIMVACFVLPFVWIYFLARWVGKGK